MDLDEMVCRSICSFDNLEQAIFKKEELIQNETDGRVYKISIKNEDGSFSDI